MAVYHCAFIIVIRLFVVKLWPKNKRIVPRWICSLTNAGPDDRKQNPLSRDEQLRINKRNQLRRDKVNGLRRVELKLNADIVDALNQLAYDENVNQGELIEQILLDYLQRSDLCTKL